jgi:hypothetical protein
VKSSLREARAKQRRGEPLTSADQQAIRAYHQGRDQGSTHIYWDSLEQKQHYQKLAEETGAKNFSRWIIAQVERAVEASPFTKAEVERLREQVEEANKRLDREAENGVYFREKARQHERERDEAREMALKLEAELADLHGQVEGKAAKPKARGGKP